MRRTTLTVAALGLAAMLPSVAMAGPCSDQIAELGRRLGQSSALGPVTTGTLTGSGPGSTPPVVSGTAPAPATAGTSADNRVGGTAGTETTNLDAPCFLEPTPAGHGVTWVFRGSAALTVSNSARVELF